MSNMHTLKHLITAPEARAEINRYKEEIDISLKMKQHREKLCWTQQELAERMGVAQTVISRIESLEGGITSKMIARFCEATGLELEFTATDSTLSLADISNYILVKGELLLSDNFDISNLKINKLLFFIELELTKIRKGRYFNYCVQAWPHGPVYPEMYHRYKAFGRDIIKESSREVVLPSEIQTSFDKALRKYISYSASQLETKSHSLQIWKDAIKKGKNTEMNF